MRVLAIETSTLITSVAVATRSQDDEVRVLAHRDSNVHNHSDILITLIDETLRAASLPLAAMDGLAIGAGPGSFTGLRIGMSTAKGLAFAVQRPLWSVSSLAALALAADDNHADDALVVPLLDARRQEIFAGFYRVSRGVAQALAEERVVAPTELPAAIAAVNANLSCQRIIAIGDALTVYQDILDSALHGVAELVKNKRQTPSAIAVAQLVMTGESADVSLAGAPVYIRPAEAERKFPDGNPGGTFSSRA